MDCQETHNPDRSADHMQREYEPIHGFQFLVYELFSFLVAYGLMSWRNQSVGTSFPRPICRARWKTE